MPELDLAVIEARCNQLPRLMAVAEAQINKLIYVEVPALLTEVKRLQARIQHCASGHEYLANSHEYPCPWCENAKLEARVAELEKQVSDAWVDVNDYAALEKRHADLVETVKGLGVMAEKGCSMFDVYAGLADTEEQTQEVFGALIEGLQAVIAAAEGVE